MAFAVVGQEGDTGLFEDSLHLGHGCRALAGDLVCVFLKPECSAPEKSSVGLKRLVLNMLPGITTSFVPWPR